MTPIFFTWLDLAGKVTEESNTNKLPTFSTLCFVGNNPVPPTKVASLFKIDYDALYSVLCKKASGEATTLLLYFLIHRNHSFKSYLLNKIDIEHLVSKATTSCFLA